MSMNQYDQIERKGADRIAAREGIHRDPMQFIFSLDKEFGRELFTYRENLDEGHKFLYSMASTQGRVEFLLEYALDNYLGAEHGMPSDRGELWELARTLGIYTYDVACDGVLTGRIARYIAPAALAVPGFII